MPSHRGIVLGEANIIAYNRARRDQSRRRNSIRANYIFSNSAARHRQLPARRHPERRRRRETPAQSAPELPLRSRPSTTERHTVTVHGILKSSPNTTYDLDFFDDPVLPAAPEGFPPERVLSRLHPGHDRRRRRRPFRHHVRTTPHAPQHAAHLGDGHGPFGQHLRVLAERHLRLVPPARGRRPAARTSLSLAPTSPPARPSPSGRRRHESKAWSTRPTMTVTRPPSLPAPSTTSRSPTRTDLRRSCESAWIADFLDVPGGHQFHSFVDHARLERRRGRHRQRSLRRRRSDAPAADGGVPPEGRHGLCYVPPPLPGPLLRCPLLLDVRQLDRGSRRSGITGGCGAASTARRTPSGATRWPSFF